MQHSERPWVVHEATVRGLQTAWIESGIPGNPVVFMCHGFPDDPSAWSEQIRALTEKYHVIAPYVRGCDRSQAADDLKRYGSDAILLDHLEILNQCVDDRSAPVTVVGHDLGAVHAIAMARALGPRLAALIVINGADVETFSRRLNNPKQAARSWYMGLMQVPLLPEALVKFAPTSCAWLAGEIGGLPEHLRDAKNFERRTVAPLNQYRALVREMPKSRKDRPARIKAPMLILWGKDDGFLEPPARTEWERIGLNFTIRILEGGHWLHREMAEVVNPLMTDFIQRAFAQRTSDESDSKLGVAH